MSEKLLGGDAEINVLLEAVIKEVLHDRRNTLGNRRAVVLYDPEKCRHGIKEMVWRLPFEEFDNNTAYTPTKVWCSYA